MPHPLPSIDCTQLANGTLLLVETSDDELFEIEFRNVAAGQVFVTGNDPRLHAGAVG